MKKLLKKKSYYKVQGSDYNDLIDYVEEVTQNLGDVDEIKSQIDEKVAQVKKELVDGASADYDTFKEVADYIKNHEDLIANTTYSFIISPNVFTIDADGDLLDNNGNKTNNINLSINAFKTSGTQRDTDFVATCRQTIYYENGDTAETTTNIRTGNTYTLNVPYKDSTKGAITLIQYRFLLYGGGNVWLDLQDVIFIKHGENGSDADVTEALKGYAKNTDVDKTISDVKKEIEGTYAKQEGYYPDLVSGTAVNLEGKNDVINSSMYRPTGGVYDVDSGSVTVESIRGNAVAWNQLVKNGNFADDYSYWNIGNIPYSIKNNVLTLELRDIKSSRYITQKIKYIKGHKYLYKVDVKSDGDGYIALVIGGHANVNRFLSKNVLTSLYIIAIYDKEDVSTQNFIEVNSYDENNANVQNVATYIDIRNAQLFDLTLIYGAGNEPTTPEQFEADYQRWFGKPLEYEEYDEGSIRPVLATGIKTVGFNLYSGGDFEGNANEWYDGENRILWKNDCGYTGQIHINCDFVRESGSGFVFAKIFYKNGDSEFIHFKDSSAIRQVPYTTKNGQIDKIIAILDTEWKGTIKNLCINFVWSGKRNGEYEPHWEETKPLPITSLTSNGEVIFPDGLKRAGRVYDEIFVENGVTKAVKRVGSVDLGSLSWTNYNFSDTDNVPVYRAKIDDAVVDEKKWMNICCSKYSITTASYLKLMEDKSCYKKDYITIKDSSYENTDDFKNSVQGTTLYYELAEPITYTIDNFYLPLAYRVDDFGTEQILSPENGVAPVMVTRYGVNAVDTIRRLPAIVETLTNDKVDKSEYNKLLERVVQLESKLNDLNNE